VSGEAASIARAGRTVVLKRLDADCLLDGELHPMIRQRLERVRELPLTAVANLMGVERIDGVAQLVWEFVPGTPLAEFEADSAAWLRVARETILAVEALHAAGIVHGSLHGRNVIVTPAGEVKLTHVSPLLYADPEQDAADVVTMLAELAAARIGDSPLAEVLAVAEAEQWSLAVVYERLAGIDQPLSAAPPLERAEPAPTLRFRSLAAAAVAAAAGAALAAGVLWYVSQSPLSS
jgi:hypothetical protein